MAADEGREGVDLPWYKQAAAATGDCPTAIDEKGKLRGDRPRFLLALIGLGELLLDSDDPERAIDIASQIPPQLAKIPVRSLIEARLSSSRPD